MHAIELLLDDHETVAGLFERARANQEANDISLFEKIIAAVRTHKHIEETLFYPTVADEGDDELQELVNASIEEHQHVDASLEELSALSDGDEGFAPKLMIVIEDVERHVEAEEERMFPLVEEQIDEALLEKLGTDMEAEKARFQNSTYGSIIL